MNNFARDFLERQADPQELSTVVMMQGSTIRQVSQAYTRVQSLSELAQRIGELDYRVMDENGVVRMVMSATSLDDEFGINGNFAAFDSLGVVTFYVDADDGAIYAGLGNVFIDQYGVNFKNQLGALFFQDLTTGTYDNVLVYIDGFDELVLKNSVGGKSVRMDIDDVSHNVKQYIFGTTEFSIPASVNIPAGKSYQINGVAVSSFLVAHGVGGTVPASSTGYLAPGISGVQTLSFTTGVKAGTAKNLRVRLVSAQPASGSLVITLFVNGSATALTITIPANAGAGPFSDSTHTVSISDGDAIRWNIVNNATGASGQIGGISMELV